MGWCESSPLLALTVPSHQFHGLHPLHTCRYIFGHLNIFIYTPVSFGTCRYIFSSLVNLVAQMDFCVSSLLHSCQGSPVAVAVGNSLPSVWFKFCLFDVCKLGVFFMPLYFSWSFCFCWTGHNPFITLIS